ncbi:hypothetical protein Tco_1567551, partial [Tanacetum coccineum]
KAFRSYTTEFEKKAQGEKKRYIDLIEKSVKDIIKDEVKSQLSQILPKEVSDCATPVIQSTITESLENVLDKDLFESHGKAYSIKRDYEDKDKDEDPLAGSDQGLKRRKTSKDAEPSKGSKSKESNSSIQRHQNQGSDLANTDDQPNVEAASKHDWFKKLKRPPTPNPGWNARKFVDFRQPQTWINKISQAEKPPLNFDELMSTPIEFSTYVMNNLKIDNLTQENLVVLAFNLLKWICRS